MTLVQANGVAEGAGASLGPAWYAAYTHARHEKKVAQQLKDRGIEHFLPVYSSMRRWKDRRKQIDLVLFPGYVFVHLHMAERLRVLELPGVVRFVCFNGQPAVLPGSDVQALRNGLAHGLRAETHPYLTIGRRVKVTHGPLSGAQGILVRFKTNWRLVIAIDAIMRSVCVEIDEADVAPVF
ncbi:MAG: UpxY family transcription antiterminator [Acidobacteria bacterium]|nr:UpxY family transcription antiterminator [Acidobacteriota bacterium]MBV9625378.1 UpxY family transcription antiterminator [Acidobacteriota bacterium]